MTDLNSLMKQAQEMQAQMQKAQEEIMNKEYSGESGAGLVKVTMNGKHEVLKLDVDSALLSEDKDVVEDLIAAAINDTVRKIAEASKGQMSGLAAGLNLPEGFKLPF